MRVANLSFKSCLEDISGEKYAKAQAEAYRLYGYDGVMDLEGVNAESEAFGSVLAISRTVNMLERISQEIRRRTRVVRIFPNETACLRLVSAILIEISEDWQTGRIYLSFEGADISE